MNKNRFGSFGSYERIKSATDQFVNKIHKLLQRFKLSNNIYIQNVNQNNYHQVINFRDDFYKLNNEEQEFIDYLLGNSYLVYYKKLINL